MPYSFGPLVNSQSIGLEMSTSAAEAQLAPCTCISMCLEVCTQPQHTAQNVSTFRKALRDGDDKVRSNLPRRYSKNCDINRIRKVLSSLQTTHCEV